MENLFRLSLNDLGHEETTFDKADVVICLRTMGKYAGRKDKYYIYIQTEDCKVKPNNPDGFPDFSDAADRVWGFDYYNPHEEYIYLGYHPDLDLSDQKYRVDKDIVFLGGGVRRRELRDACRNKFKFEKEFEYAKMVQKLREYNVNLIIHSYPGSDFTPWDRIMPLLTNNLFFMIEKCYIPPALKDIKMFKYERYDREIVRFLDRKQNQKIANNLKKIWKKEFDMRDLLKDKLGDL